MMRTCRMPKNTARNTAEPKAPAGLRKALSAAPKAKAQWKTLTPIARRDFITWIDSAKQAKTHTHRIAVACSKLTAGQRRPCCYAVVPMDLYRALATDAKAKATWKTLTPDARRDFTDWIEASGHRETRKDRIAKACAKLATGKRRP